MNFKLIQKIINSKNKYNLDIIINKITTNSKEVTAGDIFLALNSGYLYIEDAIKNGAVGIITEKEGLKYDIPILEVSDAKRALKSLASFKRNLYNGCVIAITGSNGKTTTKELLYAILSKRYKVLRSLESKNNLLGISNTLLQLNNDYDFLILELGMNHQGEISELSNLVKPDIGIITNVGSSHIGYLGSKENIFKAKMEITDGNHNILLFVNGLDDYLKNVNGILVFSDLNYNNLNSINVALVKEVSRYLKCTEDDINDAIKNFSGVSSRMEQKKIKNHLIIDDAYNASYESFIEGIENLKSYAMRKIIVFGDMLELGTYSRYYHQKVLEQIKELKNIVVITIGNETANLNNKYHCTNLEELKSFFKSFKWQNDDLIYLKASHRLELSSLISFFEELW